MPVSPQLHIVRFRPRRAEADDLTRRRLLPTLSASQGAQDVIAGRRGHDELDERILVSVWSPNGPPESGVVDPRLDDLIAELDVTDVRSEYLALRVRRHNPTPSPQRLLRVFRGKVRHGELDRYVAEVEDGVAADIAAGTGPVNLFLGAPEADADAFVTVSTWPDWSTIEAATGGDVRQPVATRHPERLVEADVAHFEVIGM